MDGAHQSLRALLLYLIVDWITDQPWLVMTTHDIVSRCLIPSHPTVLLHLHYLFAERKIQGNFVISLLDSPFSNVEVNNLVTSRSLESRQCLV